MEQSDRRTEKYIQMTQAKIPGLICRLSFPTIISMLISSFYNLVDSYYVGKLDSTSASGAIGIALSLMAILQATGFFFGHGSGNYISRKLGANEPDEASKMASNGFFLSMIFGAFIAILGLLFIKPLARLLGSTPTILPYAVDYIKYILIGAPFYTSSLVLNNQLRFQGNAFYAMIGIVSGALINIVLDPLFMFTFGMGISGAALATMISQMISFLLLLVGILRSGSIRISIKRFHPTWTYCREIIRGGLPSLCRQGLNGMSTVCLSLVAGSVCSGLEADAAIAAFSIVSRITSFAAAAIIGFGQGFQPICGYNYGAKLYARVREAFNFCVKYSAIVIVVISAVCAHFAPQLVNLFREGDESVTDIGALALRLQCVVFPLNSVILLTNMMLQSVGNAVPASVLASARSGLFFIPVLLVFGFTMGVFGIQLAQPVADVLTAALSIYYAMRFTRQLKEMENAEAQIHKT